MMTKEGFTKIVNFMSPWAGDLVQGRGHISYKGENALLFRNPLLYFQTYIKQNKQHWCTHHSYGPKKFPREHHCFHKQNVALAY